MLEMACSGFDSEKRSSIKYLLRSLLTLIFTPSLLFLLNHLDYFTALTLTAARSQYNSVALTEPLIY